MKSYTVILDEIVNPSRDIDLYKPETRTVIFNDIKADDEDQAKRIAKDKSNCSIWESSVYEN